MLVSPHPRPWEFFGEAPFGPCVQKLNMINRALSSVNGQDGGDTDHEEIEISNVVLFPWFSVLIGIFAYYLISRYAHGIPYTAVMFIMGALMGYSSLNFFEGNAIVESVRMWIGINGEVIILSFLPGLLFLDSYNFNVYLFRQSFSQLLVFAFPMVLAGTFLTALSAYYLLPYGWSFDLCMTFGSILAATDPVAVAVLLNDLGAPSRLKVHIAGESLLNDGSAIVFFSIFSSRFFNELGIEGFGENIGWSRGFALFFRLSLGGACIGLAFGIGLVTLLFNFNRRLSQEENVIQVTSTIAIAYLAFFTSEIICRCSGVIAVLVCGLTTKAFGEILMNDSHLTHDFWHITEHLLNSVLFMLGGAVWGGTQHFGGMDWIYLFILFGLVVLIRFVLVFAFYPITSRIGVGQSVREAVFMSYGGLRGAMGVALALLLNAEVFKYTEVEIIQKHGHVDQEAVNQYRELFADKVFGLVGGVSFLTLVICGPTSGFVLKRLGLVTPTESRTNVILHFEAHMKQSVLLSYLELLDQERFEDLDFGIVKEHVSPLRAVTEEDLIVAVERYRQMNSGKTPNLSNLKQYLASSDHEQAVPLHDSLVRTTLPRLVNAGATRGQNSRPRETMYDYNTLLNKNVVLEERKIFLDLLRREYQRQLSAGELDSRSFIPLSLLRSLDVANEGAAEGLPLDDWAATQTVGNRLVKEGDRALHAYRVGGLWNRRKGDEDFHTIRQRVLLALSFIKAHLCAQEKFKIEFASVNDNSLALAEKTVLDESREQVSKADLAVAAFDSEDVQSVKSQYVCQILLHKAANCFENLSANGLMTDREAGEFLGRYDLELRELRTRAELKTEICQLGQLGQKKISPETIAPKKPRQ